MKPKIFLLVLCGAADRPINAIGGRTPFEAALTPELDRLTRQGTQGLIAIIDDRICPETDSGVMALLGYDPLKHYTGRGALEALGMGFMDIDENAVGFRVNFGHYNQATGQMDRRTARDLSLDEQQALVDVVRRCDPLRPFPDVSCSITGFGRHRGIVCFKSATAPLSANVSNTDPGFRKVGPFGVPNEHYTAVPEECRPLDTSEAAVLTARLVNAYVETTAAALSACAVNRERWARGALPANRLLFRDAGDRLPSLQSFPARYGWSLSLYGQVPAEHGLCRLLGAEWHEARLKADQDEADYYRDLVSAVRRDPSDVVVIHIKAADEPGHDGQVDQKVQALERFDRDFLRLLVAGASADDVYIITSDHATPCELGIHSADRVPVVVSGGRVPADSTRSFGEREAVAGGLSVGKASDLLPHVSQYLSAEKAHGLAH